MADPAGGGGVHGGGGADGAGQLQALQVGDGEGQPAENGLALHLVSLARNLGRGSVQLLLGQGDVGILAGRRFCRDHHEPVPEPESHGAQEISAPRGRPATRCRQR